MPSDSPRKPEPRGSGRSRDKSGSGAATRYRWRYLVTVAVLIGVLVLLVSGNWFAEEVAANTPAKSDGSHFLTMPARNDPVSANPAQAREIQRQALLAQWLQADQTLCQYQDSTRYPNYSRPIAEHPDQVYPNQLITESHPMRKKGGGTDQEVQIQTTQSRVYLAAGESVQFTIQAKNKSGQMLPLITDRALARGITYNASREAPQSPVAMSDSGREGDQVAGDGIYSGVLNPAQTGLASFNGTIRTELSYTVNGQAGVVLFDVIYSPEVPAIWAGPVRESTEGGALRFILKANVQMPGRYIVHGRVDDARGKPFALVSFNDLLPQGSNDIPLVVAGNLLRDQTPVFPLTLRDVDAYLLKENTDPDRALMPRIEGTAYVSKTYPLKTFSDTEWSSEERSRYLTEFEKDAGLAKNALISFDPDLARQPLPQSVCSQNRNNKTR
ncbi:choice-of-anchor X domain-containing protein [Undibacterium oligocarboniphilum]|uniref:Uncharacterized protein n=1 Tax=Undibacterium oligocarboniphilum TaxID=666702 RepID=A0A850QJJ9_9BURK|nr:choice-of-anchor X domain-containing protein [Undibacterium oligocarboniphilum]MBC3871178.1 hypothetical protein [Undibacterium oligocarboniphilum]NVO79269.1 hypothetical protein [Undibacterium oligocarboniphilum]